LKTSSKNRKSKNTLFSTTKRIVLGIVLLFLLFLIVKNYKSISKFFSQKKENYLVDKNSVARNRMILAKHEDKVAGIDISEYQYSIDWNEVELIAGKHPIGFVFIRATAGKNRVDRKFKKYWKEAKNKHFTCGAYHYYRPNENSIEQANNFIETVHLEKGDFPPVLDIEKLPKNQSMDSLILGLKRWLNKVEKHYGVQPIIYSGDTYYTDFLKDEFSDYPFWIAHYDFYEEEINENWLIWQFTEKATVPGINTKVDLNIFNGDVFDMEKITIK
jgi:lysozyme